MRLWGQLRHQRNVRCSKEGEEVKNILSAAINGSALAGIIAISFMFGVFIMFLSVVYT